MLRSNLLLVLVLVICALGVVTAQHRARKLFQALEREQERARALEVEFGQLQLELSTWAVPGRTEEIAAGRLKMHRPAAAETLSLAAGGAK